MLAVSAFVNRQTNLFNESGYATVLLVVIGLKGHSKTLDEYHHLRFVDINRQLQFVDKFV